MDLFGDLRVRDLQIAQEKHSVFKSSISGTAVISTAMIQLSPAYSPVTSSHAHRFMAQKSASSGATEPYLADGGVLNRPECASKAGLCYIRPGWE